MPPPGVPADEWVGDYETCDGQVVAEQDALPLTDAWQEALNDPNRKDKERAVNVQLAEETVRLAKELYGIDLPFEDDDLSSDEDTLNKLIDFARLGSFTRVGTNGAEAGSL